MEKFQFDEFSGQVEAYVKKYNKLPYCQNCPKPYLCLICMSSIGEAILVQKNPKNNILIKDLSFVNLIKLNTTIKKID